MVSVFITVQGGHMTASFRHGEKSYDPFYTAPWWNEAKNYDTDPAVKILRGDFFCFPFGGNAEPYDGINHPIHGVTCNENWELAGFSENGGKKEILLKTELLNNGGSVEKSIRINEKEPVIYSTNRVKGFKGKTSLGHHPTMRFPEKEGDGLIDISTPVAGFTTPQLTEDPKIGGYSHVKQDFEIKDRTKVPLIEGGFVDLTRFPGPKGFDDIHIFMNDKSEEFSYTALSVPEEGYCYFQLKDPGVLGSTMFWMSNCGRHFVPWNGRTVCLGMEEITGYFHYGIKPSVEKNPLQEKGFATFIDVDGKHSLDVNFIMGLVPVDRDFKGVKSIVRKDSGHITISGRGGESIDIRCSADFLKG
jgi:hypothetical protein